MKALKKAAADNCELRIFEIGKDCRIEVDTSKISIGAVLKQKDSHGKWQICSFYSRKLTDTERKYPVGEQEFLGLICSIKHWKYYLQGPFVVKTDHQNIVHYMKQGNIQNPRIARWVIFLQDYQVEVKYWPGVKNVIADSLSRDGVCNLVESGGDFYEKLIKEYNNNTEIATNLFANKTRHKRWLKINEYYYSENVLLYKGRVVIPSESKSLINEVCQGFHAEMDHIHPGQSETYNIVKKYFYWKGMKEEVFDFVRKCEECQRGKYHNKTHGKMIPLGVPAGK